MKCRKAQKQVSCYPELSPPQKERLDEHLKVCPDCFHEFSLHQNSINLLKEMVHFEESEDFWKDYQVDLRRRLPALPLWRRAWAKVEDWTSLVMTPILGPIPAYAFSFAAIALLAFSLYSGHLSPKQAQAFSNNLVVFEGDLLSAVDDGGVTIYTLGGR